MREVNNSEDILDIRDVFKRIEELEEELEQITELEDEIESLDPDEDRKEIRTATDNLKKLRKELESEDEELKILMSFVEDFEGYGGDEEWRGNWYPLTLVRDSYWEDFAEELCEDSGYIPTDFPSWIEIDWEKTADNIKVDYTSGKFDGVTYWGR